MILEIDLTSDVPLYQQIRDQIVWGISSGQFADGEVLPSVRQLASDLGINFMTVNKAYNLLKQEGFLVTDRRQGSRVVLPETEKRIPDENYWHKLSLLLAEGLAKSRDKEAFRQKTKEIFEALGKERK